MTSRRGPGRASRRAWVFSVLALLCAAPTAAWAPAHAGRASDPVVVAASTAPDNDRLCETSPVPVDLQPGIMVAPGSDLGLTFDQEVSRQYLWVKLCLPAGRVPGGAQVLVHGITYHH